MDASRQAELAAADTHARAIAQREFESPVVLEAGAGTGKTATLVARIIVWALGEGWDRALDRRAATTSELAAADTSPHRIASEVLSRVAAITFTDLAAAEMAERVGTALLAVAGGALPIGVDEEQLPKSMAERRGRAEALSGASDHLVVRTIHAWCRRLLARYPLEAGLHPGFQVDADESGQAEAIREVVETAVRAAYGSREANALLELAVEGYGPTRVEEALAAFVRAGVDGEALRRDPLDAATLGVHLAELASELRRFFDAVGGRLPKPKGKTEDALSALEATGTLLDRGAIESVADLEGLVEALGEHWVTRARDRLKEWSAGTFTKGDAAALDDAADPVRDCAQELLPRIRSLVDAQPRRLDAGRRALQPLLAQIDRELRVRGVATYASLLVGARALLRRRPDICAQVRRDLDQLLVDEFQDTDAMQCEIVRMLALEGPLSERPGLFLVGDPKQSIYGWRNADLRAYESFVREVREAGGDCHPLCVNFRSAPALLEELDRAVSPVMLETPGLQPAFQPLLACEERAGDPGFIDDHCAPVEYWASWDWNAQDGVPYSKHNETSAARAAFIESQSLAFELRRLHDEGGVAWSDAAVLFRGLGNLEDYLGAFRSQGIPYAVERDRSFYQRREVIEAASLVRCVLDPNDHLALLTLLRSAAVGVPDAALIPLWSRDFPRRVTALQGFDERRLSELAQLVADVEASIPQEAPGLAELVGWGGNLIAALESLAALRASIDRDPPDVFVEGLRALFFLEAGEAARFLGAHRVANLDRFFRELREALAHGGSLDALLRRLRGDVADQRESEEERPKAAVQDAVRVMTIHKAKGLEFEHVYLAQLHKGSGGGSRDPRVPEVVYAPDQSLEYRIFEAHTLGMQEEERRAQAIDAAERVRTLYVGLTRAKRRVVLMGKWPAKREAKPARDCKSHIELLCSRRDLPEDLPALVSELAGDGAASWLDRGAARWRLPVLDQASGRPRRREGQTHDPKASGERASRDVERLAILRAEAETRMARPWRAAATTLARGDRCELLAADSYGDVRNESAPAPQSGGDDPNPAAAAGTVIHRILEDIVLSEPLEDELARQRDRLPALVVSLVPESAFAEAETRARELLDRLAGGSLLRRLGELEPRVIARELPLLMPPGDPDGVVDECPVGFAAGSIDLLYRDPESDELVVVDYKTDRVEGADALAERAAEHRAQGEVYVRALGEALGLSRPPRFELWFVWADCVVRPD